jgi:hypothetical protein
MPRPTSHFRPSSLSSVIARPRLGGWRSLWSLLAARVPAIPLLPVCGSALGCSALGRSALGAWTIGGLIGIGLPKVVCAAADATIASAAAAGAAPADQTRAEGAAADGAAAAEVSAAEDRAAADERSLQLYPPHIRLDGAADYQTLVAIWIDDAGLSQHVDTDARWEVSDPGVATFDAGRVRPVGNGQARVTVHYRGYVAEASVEVHAAGESLPASFKNDIIPILTRGGCNSGGCHGAARGKDGFALSLFGFDPAGDHFRITRQQTSRRLNLALPDESLLLTKATGRVPHTGGKKIEIGSRHHQLLLEWLNREAPNDAEPPPRCVAVKLYPEQLVLASGSHVPLVAVAEYDDGTTRDLTEWATFSTNNETTAAIDPTGALSAAQRGEAFVMARFDTHTTGSQVIVLPVDQPFEPAVATDHYIDRLVVDKLNRLRIEPSPICSDEDFIRRVSLDIVGRLPSEDQWHTFMLDDNPHKRAELIDQLLQEKEFSEIWAMKWAQLLMVKSTPQVSYKAAFLYNNWLVNQFASEVPIDQIVRQLLTAQGGVFDQPATNFFQVETDTLKLSENVAQVFTGIRIQCAQCHNHPFDRWTMDDYYGLAAFFAQIGRKTGEDYREQIVFNRGGGEVKHPVHQADVPPKFLDHHEPITQRGVDRRQLLADWLTDPDNPFFARSLANRVWAHFLGAGIVDPVDDFRISNPPSNPQLLDALAERLQTYQYDIRQLVRDICNSDTYQRSCEPTDSNRLDEKNFARGAVRRIPAETLSDCISQVTGAPEKFRGLPLGARATQIADGSTSTYFLTTFGRSPRTTVCDCEASTDPTLSQALHLLNGSTTHQRVRQGGLIKALKEEGLSTDAIIERLYIRTLSRRPTESELTALRQVVEQAPNPNVGLEDVFWALLNGREFLFNH